MRIIYKILIGMLIFNGVYLALAPAFTIAPEFEAKDPDDPEGDVSGYKDIGSLSIANMAVTGIGTFLLALSSALILGRLSGGSLSLSLGSVISIALIVSILTALWRGMSGIFEPMLAMGGSIASDFYTIFVVVLGVLITLTIAEMFGGQSGVDT